MVELNEDNEIEKSSTKLHKINSDENDADYFLIRQLNNGTVILGSKFLVERFFKGNKIMCDGTFIIAPEGYIQVYILWEVIEDTPFDESIARNTAIPCIYILMKTKKKQEYMEAFEEIESYR